LDTDAQPDMSANAQARLALAPRRSSGDGLSNTSAAISLREKRHSPSKICVLLDVLSEVGVASEAALSGTGLDVDAIRNPFILTSSMQFLSAARNAVRLYPGTDLGVRVGQRLHASCYGMYGYALLCSASLRQVFDVAVRYHRLANGMLEVEWVEEGGMASWIFPVHADLALGDVDVDLYSFLIDLQFAVHVTLTKDVMGSWCIPAHALLCEPAPPHAAAIAEALECPIAFDQAQNILSYPAVWLSRAPQLANAIAAAQMSAHCARLLEEFHWQADFTRRVYHELTLTPGRFPDIDTIAENLCMTSRTLRRKLEAEGTSYSDLLVGVRKALAMDYLTTTLLCTEDIAAMLGFSDAVAFRHAFKRWTGMTPGEYRRDPRGFGHAKPRRRSNHSTS
jgi:AraC-like DNA-binding protein